MSISRASLVAAPAIAVIDDAEYKVSPLRDMDLGELDRWVQKKILDTAELSSDDKTRRLAIEVAAMATWAGKYGYALSLTPEGVARYMLVGIRRNHPHVTLEMVRGWLKDEGKRTELHRAFDLANDVREPETPADPTTTATAELTEKSSTPT